MTIEETKKSIKLCAEQMNARYRKTVFDEWAVVSLADRQSRVLNYAGPRSEGFLENFTNDLGSLRGELLKARHGVGDFEFALVEPISAQAEEFAIVG